MRLRSHRELSDNAMSVFSVVDACNLLEYQIEEYRGALRFLEAAIISTCLIKPIGTHHQPFLSLRKHTLSFVLPRSSVSAQ